MVTVKAVFVLEQPRYLLMPYIDFDSMQELRGAKRKKTSQIPNPNITNRVINIVKEYPKYILKNNNIIFGNLWRTFCGEQFF